MKELEHKSHVYLSKNMRSLRKIITVFISIALILSLVPGAAFAEGEEPTPAETPIPTETLAPTPEPTVAPTPEPTYDPPTNLRLAAQDEEMFKIKWNKVDWAERYDVLVKKHSDSSYSFTRSAGSTNGLIIAGDFKEPGVKLDVVVVACATGVEVRSNTLTFTRAGSSEQPTTSPTVAPSPTAKPQTTTTPSPSATSQLYWKTRTLTGEYEVTKDPSAPVWSMPISSSGSEKLRRLDKGSVVSITAEYKNIEGNIWYELSGGGYIYSGNVKLVPVNQKPVFKDDGWKLVQIHDIGDSYIIGGHIECAVNIEKVSVLVVNSSGKAEINESAYPNKPKYYMSGIDPRIKMGTLSDGKKLFLIFADTENGSYLVYSKSFTVNPKAVTKFTIDSSFKNLTISLLDDPIKIEYDILPSDATYKEITWVSDAPNIASVSRDGIITPVGVDSKTGKGTATIIGTASNEQKQTVSVTVTDSTVIDKDMFVKQDCNMMSLPSFLPFKLLLIKNEVVAELKKDMFIKVTRLSPDKKWAAVEYNGKQGYVEYGNLTDILPVPCIRQVKSYYCGPASALQILTALNIDVKGDTSAEEQKTLAKLMGTTSSGTLVCKVASGLNTYIDSNKYKYSAVKGNINYEEFIDKIKNSLSKNRPVILHAKTKYLSYYDSKDRGHYIVVSKVRTVYEEGKAEYYLTLVDPYPSTKSRPFGGIREVPGIEAYNCVAKVSGRYIIYSN